MSLPGAASPPAVDYRREVVRARVGHPRGPAASIEDGPLPRDIMTKRGVRERDRRRRWRSPARRTPCCTCSRSRARPTSTCSSTTSIASRAIVPHLVDVRPAGRFVMSDLDRVGGVQVVMKELLDAGLLARRLHDRDREDDRREPGRDGRRRHPTARSSTRSRDPIHPWGGLAILRGNLAPDGAVMKIAGAASTGVRGRREAVRLRAGSVRRAHGGGDRARRRDRDPLRGPEGLARHAGDARGDGGASRARASARTSR